MEEARTESACVEEASAQLIYLLDEPASEDRFGAHTAIVNAIISTLEVQKHIRLIGLLGRWGTGKSTIVGRLATTLRDNYKDKFILFTYDAWAHQGDPARRSILEELIATLVGLKRTRLAKWRKTLLDISGSTESSSTTTRKRLSSWGKIVVGLLLFSPIFALTIDANTVRAAFADYPDPLSLNLVRSFLIFIILLVIVVVVAKASTMNYGLLTDQSLSAGKRLRSFVGSGEDIVGVLLTREFPSSSSTTLRRSHPTAIEFRRYLRRIIESQRPRRIVFVIDNLDRIAPSEALDIWSIMVGMVADEAHRLDAAIEPAVVLPFDPVALEEIVPGSKLQGHSAADLIEKSFDATFEVPPPVLSNWRTYFEEQYARCGLLAWSSGSTFEQYWTVRNFESCLNGNRVTPRKINRFLNRIISLSEQQLEKSSPSILSYYIANESRIQKNCLSFLRANSPGFDDTKSWQKKIAAIAFGTTENEAAQVLLSDELSDALENREFDDFENLVEVAGFSEVVTNFVENPPKDSSGLVDPAPLTALAAFCHRASASISRAVVWLRLWEAWKRSNFGAPDDLTASAILSFIDAIPDQATLDASFLASRIVHQIGAAQKADSLNELAVAGDRISELAGPDFRVPVVGDADLVLRIFSSAKEDSAFAASLTCECSFEDFAEATLRRLKGKAVSIAQDAFEVVAHRIGSDQATGDVESFFEAVGDGIREIISDVESSDQTLVASALILASRAATDELRYLPLITQLDTAGMLDSAIRRAIENDSDAVASTFTALMVTAGSLPMDETLTALSPWLSKSENASQLIASLSQMNDNAFLTVLHDLESDDTDITPLFKPILIAAIRRKDLGRLVYTGRLLKSFRKSAGWLSANEATAYANLLMNCGNFSERIREIADNDFLFFISKLSPKEARVLLADRMKPFDAARWSKSIYAADEMWLAFSRLAPEIGSQQPSKSEVYRALQLVLSGGAGRLGPRVVQRAIKVARLLTHDATKQLVRSVISSALETENAETILELANVDAFDAYVGRTAVAAKIMSILFVKLRRTRDGQRLIERHATAIANIPEPILGRIRESLQRSLSSRDEKTADWAKYVLNRSGLER